MTKILLAGATGMVGSAVLALLLNDGRVTRIVAPTRRALPPHSKLQNPIVESTQLPLDAEWWAVDGAICAIGTTRAKTPSPAAYRAIDYDYALAIATQARTRGARSFALTSSMGADARSWFRYARIKGELEDAVTQLAFASLTIVRPGFLGGARGEHRPVERAMGTLLRVATPLLPASARISPAATVAALLVDGVLAPRPGRHIVEAARIAREAALRS